MPQWARPIRRERVRRRASIVSVLARQATAARGGFGLERKAARRAATSFLTAIASVAACVASSGCQSTFFEKAPSWLTMDKKANPERILTIWADAVLHQPGRPGVRGFGGRVYFYEEGKPDPIRVDGALTVYVFDGESLNPANAAPLKKYVITADQLARHHSVSGLGHSYSIWVPWGPVGGPAMTLSLVARFDGRNGGTVLGEHTTKHLPGIPSPPGADSPIQQASHQDDGQRGDRPPGNTPLEWNERPTITSHTIPLPPSFQNRLLDMSEPSPSPMGQPKASPPPAAPPRSQETERRPVHSERPRFPARTEPLVPRDPGPLRRQPHPGGWPSSLPPTPRSGPLPRTGATPPVEPPAGVPNP